MQPSDVWSVIREMSGIRRNYELSVFSGDKMAVGNQEKAQLLVQTFKKIHSSDNLCEARYYRNRVLLNNPNILEKLEIIGDPIDLLLTISELKRAINNARQTTPDLGSMMYAIKCWPM